MSKAIELSTQATDTGFSTTLELLNSGTKEADEPQVNDASTGFLYYNASQPAYHVVDELVESIQSISRGKRNRGDSNAHTRHHVTARSLLISVGIWRIWHYLALSLIYSQNFHIAGNHPSSTFPTISDSRVAQRENPTQSSFYLQVAKYSQIWPDPISLPLLPSHSPDHK